MTDSKDIPRRLKAIRNRAKLSVRAMAERAGMSPSGYSHYETASRFKDDYLPMGVAMQIAKALENTPADPSEVIALAGATSDHKPAQTTAAGFSEETTPYEFNEHPTKPDDPQRPFRALFGNAIVTPSTYLLHDTHHGFGLFRGDILVCEMARVPRPGELVLVTIIDEDTAHSATTVRRYLPPYLASCDISDNPPLRMDQPGVTARYPVIGSIRGISQ